MSSVNVGNQEITFRYQQEGTSESFNKLLHNVIPTGILNSFNLFKVSGSSNEIKISKDTEMLISDGNVTVHVRIQDDASVTVSSDKPYVIANYNYAPTTSNYVTFESSSYEGLNSSANANCLIFGKCEYSGTEIVGFDYTRTTYAPSYYNDFKFETSYGNKSHSFQVFALNQTISDDTLGFYIGNGKAIINGKVVSRISSETPITLVDTNPNSDLYFIRIVNYARCDLITLDENGDPHYIMGEDSSNPIPRTIPNGHLPLATVNFSAGTVTNIRGSNITNIYNNNYIDSGITIGNYADSGSTLQHPHTLFL